DNLMVVPYTTCGVKLFNRRGFDEIYVATHTESMVDETVELVEQYFRRVHSIPHGSPNDFKIKTSKEKLKIANEISNTLSILLAGIASISLFVGGVGIMNIMLVSVSERTREIGIRMAIGAKRRDILLQFLIESVTLSSVGGVVGISLGLAIYYMIIYFVKWPFLFSPFSVLISFFFAFAVGIFFGFYPARKASNLKPIEALRYE
ncbi:MAG TPA: FtsX-like permease family protein, partial [Spirochaetota bacterium]|nr:FtsX-like permease family protein [Spirochaetota bacterium]